MTKHVLGVLGFAVVSIFALSQPAEAVPIDPSFVETLTNNCPANCGGVTLATDPISGLTTVMFTFNSTIPSVVAGDVKVTEFGSSTVGDLIRFENIGTTAPVAVAFIFSNDIAGGLPADVGLPSTFQSNTVTIAESSIGFAAPFFRPLASLATAPLARTPSDMVFKAQTLFLSLHPSPCSAPACSGWAF